MFSRTSLQDQSMAEAGNYNRSIHRVSRDYYSRSSLIRPNNDQNRPMLGWSNDIYGRSFQSQFHGSFSRTVPTGSVTVNNKHCDLCLRDGVNMFAMKYCFDCAEHICAQCHKSHLRFKALHHHVLQDIDSKKPQISSSTDQMISASTKKLAKIHLNDKLPRQTFVRPSIWTAVKQLKANLVSSTSVRLNEDKEEPMIMGITAVQTHFCVVIDNKNKSVKVVDTRNNYVCSVKQIREAESVSSITSVNSDQVAVLVDIKGYWKILFFAVSRSDHIDYINKIFDIGHFFEGMSFSDDIFYTIDDHGIYFIANNGQIIKTIKNKSFLGLRGIALSNDHDTIYVCSHKNDSVLSLDLDGNVEASYKDKDLDGPWGVTVDRNGYVFVCSIRSNCIHQLTADLGKVHVILRDVAFIHCAFSKVGNILHLASFEKIAVYDVSDCDEFNA